MIAAGDYVHLRRHTQGQHGSRGLRARFDVRGIVQSVRDDWATLTLPTGGRFEAPLDQLTLLVRGDVA